MSCQDNSHTDKLLSELSKNYLFNKLDSTDTHIGFINRVVNGEDFNILSYRNFYNGGGVGIGDFNNDGLDDIVLTSNLEANRIYLNLGNLKFEDITISSGISGHEGWSTGVSLVDINADGFLDIYISNSGDTQGENRKNELFINNGDLTFIDKAAEYGLDNAGYSTHASFFDYDLDGDLDCYLLNNSFRDPKKISTFKNTREIDDPLGGDRLMRNDNGYFKDVSKEAGIYTSTIGFGLGVSVSDINGDYWPDIYISNDFWERDYLYINQGNGTFSEELPQRIDICSVSSMGADIGDLNNDGAPDIFTTDMLAADNYRLKAMTMFDPVYIEDLKYRSSFHYQILQNCLQINNGEGQFQEIASMSGVSATDWSWGALIFDFENDGWSDIYVCNGVYNDIMDLDFVDFIDDKDMVKKVVEEKGRYDFRDFLPYLPSNPLYNYAFVNQRNKQFKNKAQELGFTDAEFSNGAAYGDLDNDGDLDLVINNVNMPASIYENSASLNDNHYIKVNLQDFSSENTFAIGATVKVVTSSGEVFTQQHYLNRGFQSSVAPGLFFGLGLSTSVSQIEVVWPDQTVEILPLDLIDTTIVIKKSETKNLAKVKANSSKNPSILKEENGLIQGDSKHLENRFNDFDHERLLPRMHSTEGPKIEVADINGDGLEDFLVLGATGDVDKLFFQNSNGHFERQLVPDFDQFVDFESTCAVFFDNDLDGDLDLLIGAGGNELSKGIDGFSLRYFENIGGQFYYRKEQTPPAGGQVSVIKAADFDNDGDQDLFIGGRSIPGNYGLIPASFLLRHDGGTWTNITDESLGTAGMITDAIWTDTDQDNDLDLIVVGEWMPITFFINDGSTLKIGTHINNSEGWWLDINANDIDNDGDMDFVLGNWGLNTKFKATSDRPLTLDVKDFDKNGKTEFILSWTPPMDDRSYPFHTKMDITGQMPFLKKRILKYADYAQMDYQTLFTAEERKGAQHYEAKYLKSAILRKYGGSYQLEELPFEAQVAPMFTSVIDDFNHDGIKDIWLGGNFYGLKPEVGRHDSSKGILLLGTANGSYLSDLSTASISGEIRDAQLINGHNDQKLILIGRNNDVLKVVGY